MTPTERPTADTYRIHAAWADDQRLEDLAHALRCAAEDAERAQELRAWLRLIYEHDDGAWAAGRYRKRAVKEGYLSMRDMAGMALRGEPITALGGDR